MTPAKRTVIVGALLLLVLAAFSPPRVDASAPLASLSANVANGVVHASANLSIFQNITAYEASFTLPQFSGVLEGSNSTSLAAAVQQAIGAKDSSARVSNLVLQSRSSSWMNSTSIQWLNISLSFDLSGIQTDKSGNSQVDMAWKSFSVPSNVTVGGYEVNNIGTGYLVNVAGQLASASRGGLGSPIRFTFLVNGHPLLPRDFPILVKNVETLNFSTINTPISKWTFGYDPGNLLSWSFRGGLLGVEILTTINEPGGGSRVFYGLFYRLTSKVTAPARSVANGDLIIVVFSDTPETVMGLVILSVSVLGVFSFISERRLVSGFSKKRQRR
ncbi:MAG TPA: hypothetical protein VGS11_06570 [Candidatus Bathyarchaeia archaeon]|nr:hypothetical protein [Candidatus Bathyarchaeia archaeon]